MQSTELENLPVSGTSNTNVNIATSQEYSNKVYIIAFVVLITLAVSILYWHYQKISTMYNRLDEITAKRNDLEKQKLAIIRSTVPVKPK